MVSPSSLLRPPAPPSATLLRFLRTQSDALCLFTPSVTTAPSHRCIGSAAAARNCTTTRGSWISDAQKAARLRRRKGATTNNNNNNNNNTKTNLEATLLVPPSLRPLGCKKQPPRRLSPDQRLHVVTNRSRRASVSPCTHRSFSSSSGKDGHFLRRLLGLQRQPPQPNLKPDDLPGNPAAMEEGYEGNMFSIGRGLAGKASNEPRLRCTELDGNGNVTLVNGEFRKSELIAKYGLLPRDLRKIDSSVLPHILVRDTAILISLLHLRVLIKADRVLVFDAYGSADSYIQSLFMYDLEGKLRQREAASRPVSSSQSALPYEFRALEAVLVSVTSGLEAEFEGVREPVVRVLRALEEDIDRDKLRHLLIYSKRLGSFEQKARLVRDAIEDLLEADDDLTAMYLTEKANGGGRDEDDHQEVEMLLESYHKVCDEIVQASGSLVTSIRSTEEVVKAILDANRNSLMLLELKFSIGTLGLAAGTLCSALYGMNLKNFIEESDVGFVAVSGICFACTAFVCVYGLLKLRRVQRVRMWGEGGIQDRYSTKMMANHGIPAVPRGNWRSDSLDPIWQSLPGEGRAERLRRIRRMSQVPPPANVPLATKKTNRPNSGTNRAPRDGDVKQEPREPSTKSRRPESEPCNNRDPGPASSSGAGEAAVAGAGASAQ